MNYSIYDVAPRIGGGTEHVRQRRYLLQEQSLEETDEFGRRIAMELRMAAEQDHDIEVYVTLTFETSDSTVPSSVVRSRTYQAPCEWTGCSSHSTLPSARASNPPCREKDPRMDHTDSMSRPSN